MLCPKCIIVHVTLHRGRPLYQFQTLNVVLGDDGRLELVQCNVAVKQGVPDHLQFVPVQEIRQLVAFHVSKTRTKKKQTIVNRWSLFL